jgi:hypothetical protein
VIGSIFSHLIDFRAAAGGKVLVTRDSGGCLLCTICGFWGLGARGMACNSWASGSGVGRVTNSSLGIILKPAKFSLFDPVQFASERRLSVAPVVDGVAVGLSAAGGFVDGGAGGELLEDSVLRESQGRLGESCIFCLSALSLVSGVGGHSTQSSAESLSVAANGDK